MNKAAVVLIFLFCSGLFAVNEANSQIVNAFQRGWTTNRNGWNGTFSANNFVAGQSGSTNYRNWFNFETNILSHRWLTSANLELFRGNVSGTHDYIIRDFSSSSIGNPPAMYNDSGSGTVYGTTTGFSTTTLVSLNGDGLADLQSAALNRQTFGIGGSLNGSGFRFGSTSGSSFSRLNLSSVANSGPAAQSDDYIFNRLDSQFTLDASESFDVNAVFGDSIVNYQWDLTNDGNFDFTTGSATLEITKAELEAAGIDSNGVYDATLQVTDRWGSTGITNFSISAVPEPSSLILLTAAGIGGIFIRRRKAKKEMNPSHSLEDAKKTNL